MTLTLAEYHARKRQRHDDRKAHELAARFGARITPSGAGWRIVGPSINVLVADLRYLDERDFAPAPRQPARDGVA